MNTRRFRFKSLRTFGNFAYIFGIALMIASLLTNIMPPTAASAHAAIVTGVSSCSNGSPIVTWKISNDFGLVMTILSTTPNIGLNNTTVPAASGQPYPFVTATKSYPGQSGNVTLSVTSKWTDNYSTTNSGSVNLATHCPTSVPPTNTPTKTPTAVQPTATPVTPTSTSTWDKSSLSVSGACESNNAVFTITNNGSAMTGSTSYELFISGSLVGSGSILLGAGGSTTVSYPSNGVKVTIIVYQRPGHPGSGQAKADATCGSQTTQVPPTSTPTATSVVPTATSVPPTATSVPPTATSVPPTATSVPPTATSVVPTATSVSPTATSVPPTATSVPPTATSVEPTATSVQPTETSVPPTATSVPPTATSVPPTDVPPTNVPPTDVPPTNVPPTDVPPTNVPPNNPTSTPTDPISLSFFCMGFRIVSHNEFSASYRWEIADTNLSGSGVLDAGQTVTVNLASYYPGLVSVYSGQQLMDSGYLPKTCSGNGNTPTPHSPVPTHTATPTLNPTDVVKTLIPRTSSTPEILIPVTGVDLVGGNSLPHMLFNLGLGFLGLGFVMNGLARRRGELDL